MKKTSRLSVNMTQKQIDFINDYANCNWCSLNEVIRQAIDEFMEANPRLKACKIKVNNEWINLEFGKFFNCKYYFDNGEVDPWTLPENMQWKDPDTIGNFVRPGVYTEGFKDYGFMTDDGVFYGSHDIQNIVIIDGNNCEHKYPGGAYNESI